MQAGAGRILPSPFCKRGETNMNYKIGAISGDGIGPEIVREARKVLDAVCKKYGHEFTYTDLLHGVIKMSPANSGHTYI